MDLLNYSDDDEGDMSDENDEIVFNELNNLLNDSNFQLLISSGESSGERELDGLRRDYYRPRMPKIINKTNLKKLKDSAFYQNIKMSSGFGADDRSPIENWSVIKMLTNREIDQGLTKPERCKISNNYLPNSKRTLLKLERKVYCGKFSTNGNQFITASQDHVIRIFNSSNCAYKRINRFEGLDISWCVLDVAFSPNEQHFAYSTWSSNSNII